MEVVKPYFIKFKFVKPIDGIEADISLKLKFKPDVNGYKN